MKSLLIFGLLLSQFAYAQKMEPEFGKIAQEEIEMMSYEKDKDAKALVLYDKGKSVFFYTEDGYDVRFTRHKRIKIFDKSDTESAEISIPFYVDGYGKTEVIKSIEAFTYNVTNGSVVKKKLDPTTIYEEQISERSRSKKFVFPDVQDGAILEYRYVLESPFLFNLPDWTFQDKIPTIYSEYQADMIPFYEYVYLIKGVDKFDYFNTETAKEKRTWGTIIKSMGQNVGDGIEFQDQVYTFALKDIPAFKDEAYISSVNDYIIQMDWQLAKIHRPNVKTKEIISTWSKLNEALLKHDKFGKYLKSSSKIAKKIIEEEFNFSGYNDRKKAKEIINYVKNNFEWNRRYSKYASQSAKEFFQKKNGNAADINLFLIAMLNEASINTKPLILSTRDHGKIHMKHPFDHFTNYVIPLVETEKPFLADGTENLLPYNRLPVRCINEAGLVVEKETTPKWMDLSKSSLSIEKNQLRMQLDPNSMKAKAQVNIQNTEYSSFSSRQSFKNEELKIKEYYSDKIGEIEKLEAIGYETTNRPYILNFETAVETEQLGNNIVIKPFLNLPLANNNLTQKKRKYPVDFIYPWEDVFESFIEIPDGYTIPELPKGYETDNGLVQINLNYLVDNNILTVKGNYKFKKSIYVAAEYAQIKNYLSIIVKQFNQSVLLEKKK